MPIVNMGTGAGEAGMPQGKPVGPRVMEPLRLLFLIKRYIAK